MKSFKRLVARESHGRYPLLIFFHAKSLRRKMMRIEVITHLATAKKSLIIARLPAPNFLK